MKIVQHKAAVHVCRNHIGIPIEYLGEVLPRLFAESFMLVHIAFQKRNVWLVRKNIDILRCQYKQIVILPKTEQIVTEIDNHVPVSWQHFDCFPAMKLRYRSVSRRI